MTGCIARKLSISIPKAFIGTSQGLPVNIELCFQEVFEVLIGSNVSFEHFTFR